MSKEPNQNPDWETTTPRFVAFFDIMGFKDFVARNPHEDVLKMMKEISATKEYLTTMPVSNPESRYIDKALYATTFSDSVILFSKDASVESFDLISGCAAYLLARSILVSIPLKGAIAYGNMTVDKNSQIYFGQPLIDAYLLQEDVHYYGIVAHNSIDKYMSTIDKSRRHPDPLINNVYREVKTHLKSGSISHLNLNWFEYLNMDQENERSDEHLKSLNSILKMALADIKNTVSGGPRRYIDNTESMFTSIYADRLKK